MNLLYAILSYAMAAFNLYREHSRGRCYECGFCPALAGDRNLFDPEILQNTER